MKLAVCLEDGSGPLINNKRTQWSTFVIVYIEIFREEERGGAKVHIHIRERPRVKLDLTVIEVQIRNPTKDNTIIGKLSLTILSTKI